MLRATCRHAEINGMARLTPTGVGQLDRFNLNLFFALDAILNSGTLTEAARKTHLTQPAMSVSLKKLRAIFGDDIVVYQSGGTQLTALAIALRPRVRHILQAARELIDLSPHFDPATDEGTVRFAAPDVVELIVLGPLLARMAANAPMMRVESVPFAYQTVDALFRQPLDIAIVAEPFAVRDFAREPLFSETMSCMVWRNGRYGGGLSEADYLRARHGGISLPRERLSHPVGAALQHLSDGQNVVARASSYSTLPHAIIGTDLVVTTLTSYARVCAELLPVQVWPVPVTTPTINFVAQWQNYRSTEPVIQWLLEQLRAVVRDRVGAQ